MLAVRFFSSRPLSLAAAVGGLAILVSIIGGYLFEWRWTALSGRNLWDWIDLLIVPLGLALVALLFNSWRSTREQELEAEHQREQALRDYLDAMTELMLEHHLPRSGSEEPVRTVARTRTLALLRRLDGERKGLVLQFLHDSNLVGRNSGVVQLRRADLRGADLSHADLSHADLSGATLSGATLSGAEPSRTLSGPRGSILRPRTCESIKSGDTADAASLSCPSAFAVRRGPLERRRRKRKGETTVCWL
jgi:hypothetical protein